MMLQGVPVFERDTGTGTAEENRRQTRSDKNSLVQQTTMKYESQRIVYIET